LPRPMILLARSIVAIGLVIDGSLAHLNMYCSVCTKCTMT
jgi:hypothetical protein